MPQVSDFWTGFSSAFVVYKVALLQKGSKLTVENVVKNRHNYVLSMFSVHNTIFTHRPCLLPVGFGVLSLDSFSSQQNDKFCISQSVSRACLLRHFWRESILCV